MGSLDITFAKDQFIDLLASVRSSQLPQFTIWMDQKLAEYKVFGKVPEKTPEQDYPHWIRQALQQHFKSFFGDSTAFEKQVEEPLEFPSPAISMSHMNRKRTSNTESSLSRKLPRLTEPAKATPTVPVADSPDPSPAIRSQHNDIASRLPSFPNNSNSEQAELTEEIVIKDEGLSEEEYANEEAGFKIQLDNVQAINDSATLPPLSAAFAMQPTMVPMQFAHSALPPPFHRMPHPKPGASNVEHSTPVINKTDSQSTPKSEQTNKTGRMSGGWRRSFEMMLAQCGYIGSLDRICAQQLDMALALFFQRARKLDGTPYSQRSYMMRKVDLDKIMVQNMGVSISDLPMAIAAYKAKLIEFKQETPRIPDLTTSKPITTADVAPPGGDVSPIQVMEDEKSNKTNSPKAVEPCANDNVGADVEPQKSNNDQSIHS